jgi:hypothetical protein
MVWLWKKDGGVEEVESFYGRSGGSLELWNGSTRASSEYVCFTGSVKKESEKTDDVDCIVAAFLHEYGELMKLSAMTWGFFVRNRYCGSRHLKPHQDHGGLASPSQKRHKSSVHSNHSTLSWGRLKFCTALHQQAMPKQLQSHKRSPLS